MGEQTLTMPQELIGIAVSDVQRFDRTEPEAHFTLPAHPTVKQQLDYDSITEARRDDVLIYERLWNAAQRVILDWECTVLPDRKADLNKMTSPQAKVIVEWAGLEAWNYMSNLEVLPKA